MGTIYRWHWRIKFVKKSGGEMSWGPVVDKRTVRFLKEISKLVEYDFKTLSYPDLCAGEDWGYDKNNRNLIHNIPNSNYYISVAYIVGQESWEGDKWCNNNIICRLPGNHLVTFGIGRVYSQFKAINDLTPEEWNS